MKYSTGLWVSPGSRFQICPGVPKELEAGDAITCIAVVAVMMLEQMKQRRPPFTRIIIEHIWRDPACKDSAERRNIPFACSLVDGSHVCHV